MSGTTAENVMAMRSAASVVARAPRPRTCRNSIIFTAIAYEARANNHMRCFGTSSFRPVEPSLTSPENEPAPLPTPIPTPDPRPRHRFFKDAKPFSSFLTDTFHRQHTYLRISLTERCNLRCLYCMPPEGVTLSPSRALLTSAEIYRLARLFVRQGVTKIRVTGGEPSVRADFLPLMRRLGGLRAEGLRELCVTTNAIAVHRKLGALCDAGLTGLNVSLDTLDAGQYRVLTRRNGFDAVMRTIDKVLAGNEAGEMGVKLKVNVVVMRGVNDEQVVPFVEFTRDRDLEVRFIEYMPFGGNGWSEGQMFAYSEMVERIREAYPGFERGEVEDHEVSKTWRVPGFEGRVGFITSMSEHFCGTCNRLRITADGNLKVCLHGDAEVSLRDLMRAENGGEPMNEEDFPAIGAEGERAEKSELWDAKEKELLDVIGVAVKGKKASHAGMSQLKDGKNRPMILIGG